MRDYHNILYVSHGTSDETAGLKQALSLARNNEAPLKVLVVCPEFPGSMPDYKKKYEQALIEQAEASVRATVDAIQMEEGAVDITIELESDKTPAVRIIQHVLRHGHDLLVKEADGRKGGGFKALDMDLLRKCPCPVWLCQPIDQSRDKIEVAVAIDPDNQDQAAHDLSVRMLRLADSLAQSCSQDLHIVSCWNYELETYLRGNVWIKMDDAAIDAEIEKTQNAHRAALDALVEEAGLNGAHHVHHLRGRAEEMIPGFVESSNIDILVMGTLARTGIPGFVIGNTSENIVQKLSCSLLALKPQGFRTPITAY